jgi:erythrocyte band 7 integral membrane protein
MNGATDVNGKAPLQNGNSSNRGVDEPIVRVEPPRREDLQPSYAQVIKPDTEDAAQHGWYGSEY